MTDEQIIKALECCADDSVIRCEECPYVVSIFSCRLMQLKKDAFDLINRYKAEIEKLNTVNADMHESLRLACERNKDLQAEIERLQRLGASAARKAVDERKKLLDAKAEIERLTNICQEQNTEIKMQIEIKNRLLYNLKAVCEEKAGEG